MSKIITEIASSINKGLIERQDSNQLLLSRGDISLDIYDKANLVGFKLTGTIQGLNVYIVNDTDNYDRANDKYKHLFDEVEIDVRHVAKMFAQGRIKVDVRKKRSWFRDKNVLVVTIPNANGDDCTYGGLTVNTTNFFRGDVASN